MSDPWLGEFIKRHPSPCPVCRLMITELPDGRCVNCRARVVLGLGIVEERWGGWGVLMGALLAGTGFGGFFGLLALLDVPPLGRGGFKGLLEDICIWAGIPFFLLSVAAILFRRRFCRMRTSVQWTVAWAAIIAFAMLAAAFAYSMR